MKSHTSIAAKFPKANTLLHLLQRKHVLWKTFSSATSSSILYTALSHTIHFRKAIMLTVLRSRPDFLKKKRSDKKSGNLWLYVSVARERTKAGEMWDKSISSGWLVEEFIFADSSAVTAIENRFLFTAGARGGDTTSAVFSFFFSCSCCGFNFPKP